MYAFSLLVEILKSVIIYLEQPLFAVKTFKYGGSVFGTEVAGRPLIE